MKLLEHELELGLMEVDWIDEYGSRLFLPVVVDMILTLSIP